MKKMSDLRLSLDSRDTLQRLETVNVIKNNTSLTYEESYYEAMVRLSSEPLSVTIARLNEAYGKPKLIS